MEATRRFSATAHDTTGYGDVAGDPELRDELADLFGVDAANVVVTVGGSEALHLALTCLTDPGDPVLLPRPGFPGFDQLAHLLGLRTIHYDVGGPLPPGADAALLLVCTPHNPTGVTTAVHAAPRRPGPTVWDVSHTSLTAADRTDIRAALNSTGVAVFSLSKLLRLPGARVGCLLSRDAAVVDAATAVKTHLSMSVDQLAQRLATLVLTQPGLRGELAERRAHIAGLRTVILDAVAASPTLTAFPATGGTHVLVRTRDGTDAWARLRAAGVVGLPGVVFNSTPDTARLCIAQSPDGDRHRRQAAGGAVTGGRRIAAAYALGVAIPAAAVVAVLVAGAGDHAGRSGSAARRPDETGRNLVRYATAGRSSRTSGFGSGPGRMRRNRSAASGRSLTTLVISQVAALRTGVAASASTSASMGTPTGSRPRRIGVMSATRYSRRCQGDTARAANPSSSTRNCPACTAAPITPPSSSTLSQLSNPDAHRRANSAVGATSASRNSMHAASSSSCASPCHSTSAAPRISVSSRVAPFGAARRSAARTAPRSNGMRTPSTGLPGCRAATVPATYSASACSRTPTRIASANTAGSLNASTRSTYRPPTTLPVEETSWPVPRST